MTLPAVPTIPQILAEISQALPYTFPDNRTRWLAEVASNAPLVFPTSFANKQSVKVVASVSDAGGSSQHTFSGVNFGLPFSDRVLIACIGLRSNAPSRMDISAVTIGGVSAAGINHGEWLSAGPSCGAGVYSAAVPSGTSGDVVVTWGGGTVSNAAGIILLSMSGGQATPYFQGGQAGSGSGGTSSTANFNIPSNGVLVVASTHTNTNPTTFSGVTDRASLVIGSALLEVGYDNRLGAATGTAVTASWSGTAARGYAGCSFPQP